MSGVNPGREGRRKSQYPEEALVAGTDSAVRGVAGFEPSALWPGHLLAPGSSDTTEHRTGTFTPR